MSTNSKDVLDFIVIGAQKAGTTTLFRHLIEHPSIYMPPEKEAPFFNFDEEYKKGWDWFLQAYFADAPQDKLWGKVTPQYMGYPQVPERIAKQFPQVKLIALLRDPIARAYSHYRMSVRNGIEARPFDEAVRTQLRPSVLEESRSHPNRTNSYVIWGEYGRIMSAYLRYFRRGQTLILLTEDLESRPGEIMTKTYNFLSVKVLMPETLGQKFHQGGAQQRLPLAMTVMKIVPVQTIKRALPIKLRRKLGHWHLRFQQWNTIPEEVNSIPLEPKTLQALQEHYLADAAVLEESLQVTPPWLPFPASGGS